MAKSYRTVEIMNDLEHGFTIDVVSAVLADWVVVKDYAYILHDSDTKADGTPKRPHIHCMVRFNNAVPAVAILARVKAVTGRDDIIKDEHLQKCYRWTSAVAYLTHENRPEKHRYSRDLIVSNYDFNDDINAGVAGVKDIRWQEIAHLIDTEELREYNITDYCTLLEYTKYKKQINSAFEYVYSRKAKEIDRIMDVMYISGTAGSGKTTFAKRWCEKANMSYVVSSSGNDPMQDYKGQDVLIMDDFRPSDWRMADLLKLLDNHTTSSVKSRYHNKYMCYCKLIIITSVIPLDRVWANLADKDDALKEPVNQLLRRVTMSADVSDERIMLTIGETVMTLANPVQKLDDSEQKRRAIEMAKLAGFTVTDGFVPVYEDLPFDLDE